MMPVTLSIHQRLIAIEAHKLIRQNLMNKKYTKKMGQSCHKCQATDHKLITIPHSQVSIRRQSSDARSNTKTGAAPVWLPMLEAAAPAFIVSYDV